MVGRKQQVWSANGFGPFLDGKPVVETAGSAFKGGRQAKVPLLIGSNSAEVPAGFVNAKPKEESLFMFGNVKDEMTKAYDPDENTEFSETLSLVNTD